MNKIFLIDGHAQIFRMYYAFMRRPMINSKGVDTSILFGFTKMLLELIEREKPTHLAVSFDLHARTFRHKAFPAYKANRGETPELIIEAFEPLQEILAALNIPVVAMEGFEADDVIGSMATQWNNSENQVYMVTPDKDYGQLICDNVFQYKPSKGSEVEIIGKNEICEKYNIANPSQVIDILTIWGDSSDNVPGVRGIGEVGARKLVSKYGSVEEIVAHREELTKKQQEAIEEALQQIPVSKFLVTIKTDIALPVTKDEIAVKQADEKAVNEIFGKYEFNSLKKLMHTISGGGAGTFTGTEMGRATETPGSSTDSATGNTASVSSTSGNLVDSLKMVSLKELDKSASTESLLAIKMVGEGMVLSARNRYTTIESLEELITEAGESKLLRELMENSDIAKVGFGFKEIIKRFRSLGIELNGFLKSGELCGVMDLELMHYILNPERSHSEEKLINGYFNIDLQSAGNENGNEAEEVEADLFSSIMQQESRVKIEMHDILACSLYIPLYRILDSELHYKRQWGLYSDIEMPLIGVLSDMEWEGVKIDTGHLHRYSSELTAEMKGIESEIRRMADEPELNISSPRQVGILLFEKLKLSDKVKKSSRGNYPTDEETLNEVASAHPVVPEILEFRALKKLISTYIDALPGLINPKSGKVHTTFNQALTATGRLSSANPNLQNIPIRSERGKEIRKAFVPSDRDGAIVSADYSQIELRLMAHMSGDKSLIEDFNHGKDIHAATAAKIFKESIESVTRVQRSMAKTANFGIIYGISPFGLAQRMGISRSESKAIIEEYFNSYPGVKEYINNMISKAGKEGYVETVFGRRRYLPDINSKNATVRGFNERNAVNAPLQGSAADIIKLAMVELFKRFKKENIKSKIVLQVHDELIIDAIGTEVERVKEIVTDVMENVVKLSVPLVAECGSGANWLEAH